MATATIQVAAVTSPDQFRMGNGKDKVSAVKSPDDEDATYIHDVPMDHEERYSLAASGIPVGSAINSVSSCVRLKRVSNITGWKCRLILGGNIQDGASHGTSGSAYATTSDVITRPGGGSWALSDLTTLRLGIVHISDNNDFRVTSLYAVVDYTPPANTGDFFKLF